MAAVRRMSLARQLLLLQVVVVAVSIGVVGAFSVQTARSQADQQQRERVRSVAEALAASADVRAAVRSDDPPARLQPIAERVRRNARLAFVVFMTPDGIRYTHPNPARIGGHFVGATAPARAGRAFTEEYTGTLGPSVRAVVPVRAGGRVVALVSVGVLTGAIAGQVRDQLPGVLASLAIGLAVGSLLCLLLARRVRRQTRGLDPEELGALYEHHDAVLHAIREGVVVVGHDGTLRLANDEAHRLLGLRADAVGRPVDEVVEDPELAAVLRGRGDPDVHVVGGRVLIGGRREAEVRGREIATVTTLRDRTELEHLVRELATVHGLAEALRAQAHEAANELHTVVGLVELGRHDDAIAFATRRIGVMQDEVDLVQSRIGDPALAALLLAKAAACRERGVQLELAADSALGDRAVPSEELVTIVGNLIDNALDALAEAAAGKIAVRVAEAGGLLEIEVRDNGPGLPADALAHVFEAGWSTKPSSGAGRRGLGLALVRTAAGRLGGTASARNDGGAVIDVRIPLAVRA